MSQVTEVRRMYEERVLGQYLETSHQWRSDCSPKALEHAGTIYEREFGSYLPAASDAPILELGCGPGSFLSYCAARGFTDVTGIDVSQDQVDFCHRRGVTNAKRADALEFLSSSRRAFELIAAIDVLEHLPKDVGFAVIAGARERLSESGRLILRVPNMSNPLNLQARYGDLQHEVGFAKESLEQLFRAAGLEPEQVYSPDPRHPNPIVRLVFDVVLWKAFVAFYRRSMRLRREVIRGKNLIGVARRADDA